MMLFKSQIAFFLLAIFTLLPTTGSAQFWYSSDGPSPLTIDSSKMVISFTDDPADTAQALLDIPQIEEIISVPYAPQGFAVCSLSTVPDYLQFLDSVRLLPTVKYVEPCYLLADGSEFLLGDRFIVLFDYGLPQSVIDSLALAYDVLVIEEMRFLHNEFVLQITPQSPANALEISNTFHEMENVTFAHPLFGTRISLSGYTPYDFYRNEGRHVQAVVGDFANSNTCWDITTGSPDIIVAVVDGPVLVHEDLPASRILPGYDFVRNSPFSLPYGEQAHGQCVAGLIAASHSTNPADTLNEASGVISMAPGVKILPVMPFRRRLYPASHSEVQLAMR